MLARVCCQDCLQFISKTSAWQSDWLWPLDEKIWDRGLFAETARAHGRGTATAHVSVFAKSAMIVEELVSPRFSHAMLCASGNSGSKVQAFMASRARMRSVDGWRSLTAQFVFRPCDLYWLIVELPPSSKLRGRCCVSSKSRDLMSKHELLNLSDALTRAPGRRSSLFESHRLHYSHYTSPHSGLADHQLA